MLYLKQKIDEISQITIKGVQGITKIYTPPKTSPKYLKQGDVYTKKDEYILERPDGSNLFDLLIRDEIDSTRTYSIDPNEMLIVFGIEVARFMLENQLIEVFGTKVNPRHIGVLCDRMNRGGDFMSVDRHGINKENIGPLAKSSFEETTDQLQAFKFIR